ncbi:MAG: hypothetical protein ACOC56_04680 [Atribacterota bacterium]
MNRTKELKNIIEDLESLRDAYMEGKLTDDEYVEDVRKKASEIVIFDMAVNEKLERREDDKIMQD